MDQLLTFNIEGIDTNLVEADELSLATEHIPDTDAIKNIKEIELLTNFYRIGKTLQNKHRTSIAKAVINECLLHNKNKLLVYLAFNALYL